MSAPLQETPLLTAHKLSGGKVVDFGGWAMPVNYGSQIEEHHAVRQHVGIFDVSHMTIVDVRGEQVQAFLRFLLANDVQKLKTMGQALYSAMLNESGGVIDDLIVYLMPWGYRLVVNCGTREKDLAWITQQASAYGVTVHERAELAMIAVQGPQAMETLAALLSGPDRDKLQDLSVFHGVDMPESGEDWFVARTGYTGEDGYEMLVPATHAERVWQALVDAGARPCGLGARDTLRLEAGMNLYGHEMDDAVSPLEANMAWTIAWREEPFLGSQALLQEKAAGVKNKLVGLVMRSKGVLREGYEVKSPESDSVGKITSGTFSPTIGCSIALARVPVATKETAQVNIRGKWVDVDVVKPCFVRKGKVLV